MARRMAIPAVLIIAAFFCGCGGGGGGTGSGKFSVKETVMATIPMEIPAEAGRVSSDMTHVIYVVKHGKKERVVLDGKESKEYDNVLAVVEEDYGWNTNQSGIERFDVETEFRFTFSPDSKRVAYAAKVGKKRFAVVDGQEGSGYDDIEGLAFSPDSLHIAYVVKKGDKATLVVDGAEKGSFDSLAGFLFNADGTLKYAALDGGRTFLMDGEKVVWEYKSGDRQYSGGSSRSQAWDLVHGHAAWVEWAEGGSRVVFDGVAGKRYEDIDQLRLSPDGKRTAYIVRLPKIEKTDIYPKMMVVDGVEGPKYAGIEPAVFSPDGRRVAYVGNTQFVPGRGANYMVVVDGVESPAYATAQQPIWSQDGQHYAYGAVPQGMTPTYFEGKGQEAMYLDGQAGKVYGGVRSPVFSPDGTRLAYIATISGMMCVVVDDKEGDSYVKVDSISFSPDSKHVAYSAEVGQNKIALVDGRKSAEYNEVEGLAWSPDSKHYAFRANIPPDWILYIDGSKAYSRWERSCGFDSDGVIRGIAGGDSGQFLKVEISPK